MCDLCSDDRRAVHDGLMFRVEQLRKLAAMLQNMADGYVKPHTPEAGNIAVSARSVIRFLVEDWL